MFLDIVFPCTYAQLGGVNVKLLVSICPKIFLTGYLEDATYKTFLSGISEKEKQKNFLCT